MPLVFIILIVLAFFAIIVAYYGAKIERKEFKRTGKHPEGYYVSLGIALGLPLGLPIGLALGNIALGIPFGLPLGLVIGMMYEEKHKKELRPHTKKEKEMRAKVLMFCLGLLALGFVAGMVAYFLYK